MKIIKIFVGMFILSVFFTAPVIGLTESNNKERGALSITIEELSKDLAELQTIINKLNEQIKNMTPEERNKFCKKLQERYKKSPLDVPIQFEC